MRTVVFIALTTLFLWAPAPARALQGVTLGWETTDSPVVGGYKVYYGTDSGLYQDQIYVGNVGEARIDGLEEGVTYYFAITVYDLDGAESRLSDEVIYTVPIPPPPGPLRIKTLTSKSFVLDVTTTNPTNPAPWKIEMSGDFWTWYTVAQGTNSTASVAVLVADSDQLFFRLRSFTPGARLIKTVPSGAFPNSFSLAIEGGGPMVWDLQGSTDLKQWDSVIWSTNSLLNVSVVPGDAPSTFFRLKDQ